MRERLPAKALSNNSMRRTARRAAADAERSPGTLLEGDSGEDTVG